MATGYTAKLYDGKPQTFQEFALDASRAMGAAIYQRDDPMDVPTRPVEEVPDYYEEWYNDAVRKLEHLEGRDQAGWIFAERDEREKANKVREESNRTARARVKRYKVMLAEVEEWQPPTPEHQGFKDFMVEQLTSSINFDAPFEDSIVEPRPWSDYKHAQLERARQNVERTKEQWDEQVARTASRNKWVADLFDSLGID